MNINHKKNYDTIVDLPTDEIPLTDKEIEIFNIIFKEEEGKKHFINKLIEPILIGFIFVLLSIPCINNILFSSISENVTLIIKTLLIMIIFYLSKTYILQQFKI